MKLVKGLNSKYYIITSTTLHEAIEGVLCGMHVYERHDSVLNVNPQSLKKVDNCSKVGDHIYAENQTIPVQFNNIKINKKQKTKNE